MKTRRKSLQLLHVACSNTIRTILNSEIILFRKGGFVFASSLSPIRFGFESFSHLQPPAARLEHAESRDEASTRHQHRHRLSTAAAGAAGAAPIPRSSRHVLSVHQHPPSSSFFFSMLLPWRCCGGGGGGGGIAACVCLLHSVSCVSQIAVQVG